MLNIIATINSEVSKPLLRLRHFESFIKEFDSFYQRVRLARRINTNYLSLFLNYTKISLYSFYPKSVEQTVSLSVFELSVSTDVFAVQFIPATALISRIIRPMLFFPIGTLLNQMSPFGLCFGVR